MTTKSTYVIIVAISLLSGCELFMPPERAPRTTASNEPRPDGRGPPTYEIQTLADARTVADRLKASALGRTLRLNANNHEIRGVLKDTKGPMVILNVDGNVQTIDLVNIVEVWVE